MIFSPIIFSIQFILHIVYYLGIFFCSIYEMEYFINLFVQKHEEKKIQYLRIVLVRSKEFLVI